MTRKSPAPVAETLTIPATIEETASAAEAPAKRRPGRQPQPGNRSALGVSIGIKLYPEELARVAEAFPGATNASAVLEVVKMFLADTNIVAMTAEVTNLHRRLAVLEAENDGLQQKIAKAVDALALTE